MYYSLISSMNKTSLPSYTARTTAFATATAITDTTILNALNTFDLGLISNGLDTKMKALYPFVGGTSTTHKYNFMDARDLDAAYRLAFNGGGTHSSNGYQPGGVNGFANTFLGANVMSQNSVHISFYSRTNTDGDFADIGSYNGAVLCELFVKTTGSTYVNMNTLSSDSANYSLPSTGLFLGTRTASNVNFSYRNAVKIINGTRASLTPSSIPIYLGARNSSGTALYFSNRQQAFASIGTGLSDTDASNLYTLVQAFQTSLTRNV